MSDIAAKVMKIVTEHLGVSSGEVTPESKFVDDLGGDSLDVIELVMVFEDEFEINIEDADIEQIVTVQDAISYVESAKGLK